MNKTVIIHPFLFAIFPILSLFSYNQQEMLLEDILPSSITILATTTLLWLLLIIIFKDKRKTALIISFSLFLFFSYGHFYNTIRDLTVFGIEIGRHRYLLLLWCLFFIFINYFILKTRKNFSKLTTLLNLIIISLVLISLINIGYYEYKLNKTWSLEKKGEENISTAGLEKTSPNPDIYYIILDAHVGQKTLREMYNYDNPQLLDFLTEKGFYIASQSRSNYPTTAFSLSSSLNMKYIHYLSKKNGRESKISTRLLVRMIENNKVQRFLKSRGYKFIYFNSGIAGIDYNKYADLNFQGGWLNEFSRTLLKTTIFNPFSEYLIALDTRKRILYIFDKTAEIPKISGPKFVFVHILSPHEPFVFGQNGEEVVRFSLGNIQADVKSDKQQYLNQLIFIDKKVKTLIDAILSQYEIPPIIIVQADHGTGWVSGWNNPGPALFKESLRIFNAYYLPGEGKSILYESITPVNTFRLIFSYYFGADLDLLDDESYFYIEKNDKDISFTNVTAEITDKDR